MFVFSNSQFRFLIFSFCSSLIKFLILTPTRKQSQNLTKRTKMDRMVSQMIWTIKPQKITKKRYHFALINFVLNIFFYIKIKKKKMQNLLNVSNRISESAYYWHLLLEQEQNLSKKANV